MWKRHIRNINVTFSILYGSSDKGIAFQLNISEAEAHHLVELYFTTFPGVRRYIDSSHYVALNNQMVITPFGQRKLELGTLDCFRSTAAYNASFRNAQNVIIQSTTSTLGLITFAELNEALKRRFGTEKVKCICTVYDSLEIECDQDIAAEVFEICYYYMDVWPVETFDWLELPIGCEGEIGISWGELETVHKGVTQAEIDEIIQSMKATADPM